MNESDKHSLHIEEHIRCLIGNEFKISDKQKDKLNEHIKTHRQYERLTRQALALQA